MVVVGGTNTVKERGRSRRPLVFTVAAIVIVVGLFAGHAALANPHLFAYRDETGIEAHVGQVVLIGMGSPSATTVIRRADALLAKDSRRGSRQCRRVPARQRDARCHVRLGLADRTLRTVVPAVGARLRPVSSSAQGFDYLVLAVVPLAGPGYAIVDGIHVTHSSRWHDVSEHVGTLVKVGVSHRTDTAAPSCGDSFIAPKGE